MITQNNTFRQTYVQGVPITRESSDNFYFVLFLRIYKRHFQINTILVVSQLKTVHN